MTKKTASKPIIAIKGYAVVVTDKGGQMFVRTRGNGHPTVNVLSKSALSLTLRDIQLFHDRNIAECYKKETVDFVKRDFSGTKICPRPPFTAEVVPFTVQIG